VGQKNANFFTDPAGVPPQPPKQDPKLAEIQAKAQADAQLRLLDAHIDAQKPQDNQAMVQAQAQLRSDQMKIAADNHQAQLKAETDRLNQQWQNQMEAQKRDFELLIAKLNNDGKIAVAQIMAKTQLTTAAISANSMVGADGEGNATPSDPLKSLVDTSNENMQRIIESSAQQTQALLSAHQDGMKALVQQLSNPRTERLTRIGEGQWERTLQ
jgi:bisphosphoglycerate-dependent phosphoglycerate mutase